MRILRWNKSSFKSLDEHTSILMKDEQGVHGYVVTFHMSSLVRGIVVNLDWKAV